MPKNFTSQSILVLEATGLIVQNVEVYNHATGKKKDLFGFADLLAFNPNSATTIFIQVTDFHNARARYNKIIHSVEACAVVSLCIGREIWLLTWQAKEYKIQHIVSGDFTVNTRKLVKELILKREKLSYMKAKEMGYRWV